MIDAFYAKDFVIELHKLVLIQSVEYGTKHRLEIFYSDRKEPIYSFPMNKENIDINLKLIKEEIKNIWREKSKMAINDDNWGTVELKKLLEYVKSLGPEEYDKYLERSNKEFNEFIVFVEKKRKITMIKPTKKNLLLWQEWYENELGYLIHADEIDGLASYVYCIDGFFDWICPFCGTQHESRSLEKTGGTVWTCDACNKKSLLCFTNIECLYKAIDSIDFKEFREEANKTKRIDANLINNQFYHLSDLELVQMKKDLINSNFEENKEYLNSINEELKHRQTMNSESR